MDSLTLGCHGTLSLHRDDSITCSETFCLVNSDADQAIGSHSSIVVCRRSECLHCQRDRLAGTRQTNA